MDRTEPADALAGEGHGAVPAGARDAAEVLARATADQAAADAARVRLRRHGLPTVRPDASIEPLLANGEHVISVRHAALLDRREPSPGTRAAAGVGGELYLTTRRLLLRGRLTVSLELEAIDDVVVSAERLLLTLRGSRGVTLQVGWPRLLAVEIAAARSATTAASGAGADRVGQPASR